MVVILDEEILMKTGAELFKELLRVYPVAEFEDYYRGGQWKEELMRTDLHLIYAHAREAGAPYPPPLEEVKLPGNVPKAVQLPGAVRPTLAGGVRPVLAKPPVPTPMGAAATPAAKATAATPAAAATTAPAEVPAATAASSQATELRLIALFVAKWKLDATRTKLMLAKLTPPRRRYIITNFKNAGGDPTVALEQFIAKCEQTDAWAAAAVSPAMPAAAAVPAKRPLTPTMPEGSNKVPRLMTPGTVTPAKAGVVRPMGAVRPLAAAGGLTPRAVRPPGLRPAGLITPRG